MNGPSGVRSGSVWVLWQPSGLFPFHPIQTCRQQRAHVGSLRLLCVFVVSPFVRAEPVSEQHRVLFLQPLVQGTRRVQGQRQELILTRHPSHGTKGCGGSKGKGPEGQWDHPVGRAASRGWGQWGHSLGKGALKDPHSKGAALHGHHHGCPCRPVGSTREGGPPPPPGRGDAITRGWAREAILQANLSHWHGSFIPRTLTGRHRELARRYGRLLPVP